MIIIVVAVIIVIIIIIIIKITIIIATPVTHGSSGPPSFTVLNKNKVQ